MTSYKASLLETTDYTILRLDSDLLDERRARAEELPMSLAWFRRVRLLGGGPPVVRISNRIFYRRGDLRSWIAQGQTREEATR